MNSNGTKLVALVSFGLGGLGGYFLAKKSLKEHYETQAQMDIDDVKDYFSRKYGESGDNEKYRKIANVYTKPDLHDLATSKPYSNGEVKYTEETVEEDQEVEDEEEEDSDDEMEAQQEELNNELEALVNSEKEPYLIDYQQFTRDSGNLFDKVSLFYYRFDKVMCNTDDSIVEAPEETLGYEYQKELESKTTAFVRNEKLQIDYEIHSLSNSYSEEVKKKLMTDTERKYSRLARYKEAVDRAATEEEEVPVKKKPVGRTRATRKHNVVIEDEDAILDENEENE